MAEMRKIDIVDDDAAVRDALSIVFEVEGFAVRGFADGASFMRTALSDPPSVVLLDVHMPGKSGLDILKELGGAGFSAPIFIISGQGDIPMAVQAIKDGAFDFIEKPFEAQTVVDCVHNALAVTNQSGSSPKLSDFPGRETLTPRELDVLDQISAGQSNKEAARNLGISPRTVEVHRARIMEKIGARNAADLVRIVLTQS
ncbi:MAG: response regulator transcription factor [Rhodobiaceae bacterium]|nr:response regulator transcription factor [Rhodobiaceae bacterium]